MPAFMAVMLVLAQSAQSPQVEQQPRPYWDTCRRVWQRAPYVAPVDGQVYLPGSVVAPRSGGATPAGGGGGGSPSLSGLGGGGSPEALLVIAVIALAVLPLVVYAVDAEADELTLDRFHCPELTFTAMAGTQIPTGPGDIVGVGIAKLRADFAYLGGMAEIGLLPSGGSLAGAFSAHLLVRPPPKAHIEGALALGVRRAIGPGGALDGLEVALPHMYVFKRDGYKKLGLEAMPRVFFRRGGIDVGAELTLAVPIFDVLQARVGAGAFSFAGQTQLTASAGLAVHL